MKQWILRQPQIDPESLDLSWPNISRLILANRGVNLDSARAMLSPSYVNHLHDPFVLTGMDQAVAIIKQAVQANQRIALFGDYDADGVPGTAVLAEFFSLIGFSNFEVYFPDRFREGFGLSARAVEQFAKSGVNLLITIDCGVTDVAEIALAKSSDLTVIITDHHLPGVLPAADVIINPKQEGDEYLNKNLCGCGVVFKLVQALIPGFPNFPLGQEKWLLDLVAIATVGDLVPLVGENWFLVRFGLEVLRRTRRPGLISLFRHAKLNQQWITEDDLAFTIVPRLNAAGRMAHASEAFELLTTRNLARAEFLAETLDSYNRARRNIVDDLVEEYRQQLIGVPPEVIVAGRAQWPPGILGLGASRLMENFSGRPTFLWGMAEDGEVKGSCRSSGTVNVVELMAAAGGKNFFLDFGGHSQAGGFSLSPERLGELPQRLINAYNSIEKKEIDRTEIAVDSEIFLKDFAEVGHKIINLAPFGEGFAKPIFLFSGVCVDSIRAFGKIGAHLELLIRDTQGNVLPAISFFADPSFDSSGRVTCARFPEIVLVPGQQINLLASIERETFRHTGFRLRVVDLQAVGC